MNTLPEQHWAWEHRYKFSITSFINYVASSTRLGQEVYTSTMDVSTLSDALEMADVVIGAIRPEKGTNRMVVSEEMVANMKAESVIVDVSIDQGRLRRDFGNYEPE